MTYFYGQKATLKCYTTYTIKKTPHLFDFDIFSTILRILINAFKTEKLQSYKALYVTKD